MRRRIALGGVDVRSAAFSVALTVFGIPGAALADSMDEIRALQDENAALRRMIENQTERLERLEEQSDASASDDGLPFSLEFSGFIKFDTYWNNSQVGTSTSAPRFANERDISDGQYTSTVQNSRFVLELDGPEVIGGARLVGRVEMDLFNLGDTGDANFTNNQLRVRQLYAALQASNWRVLLGQTWDLFGPLNANTLNTNGNFYFGGNVGFRRPQIQTRRRFDFDGGWSLTPAVSMSANSGVSDPEDLGIESGRDSGVPLFQGSLISKIPFLDQPLEVGAWGVWGIEDLEGLRQNVDQWGVGGHLIAPFTDWLTLQGEVHHGRNLDGGLAGAGVNDEGRGIKSTGGFGQLTVEPAEGWELNAVGGIDNPRDSRLDDGDRRWNRVFALNVKRRTFEHLTMGLEYKRFDTNYKNGDDAESNLIWVSAILDF